MDLAFLYNRYLRNRRVLDGYKYQFSQRGQPIRFPGGGFHDEIYYRDFICKFGDTFVDVGANVGSWTIPASRWYSVVYSFEPSPKTAETFLKNCKLNEVDNVRFFAVALGNKDEKKEFYLHPIGGADSFNSEHVTFRTPTAEKVVVQVRTLDSFHLYPTVLKIDTEGWEIPVLQGAFSTIRRARPTLLIETHSAEDAKTIPTLEELKFYSWQSIVTGQVFNRKVLNNTILIGEVREELK